jgi:hypothetical protein
VSSGESILTRDANIVKTGDTNGKSLNIGTLWEPLVDTYLIDELNGAEHILHAPERREIVMTMDTETECSVSYYHNLFKDGDEIRMYYRGLYPEGDDNPDQTANIAFSDDGRHFT